MTIGENIRRLRKERGLTLKQLGEAIGVSESYIRAYESGRRNPKQKSLEALARALCVNVEALTDASFDSVKAMHMLFQIFRQYNGEFVEYEDKDGNSRIGVSFGNLLPMDEWHAQYEKCQERIEKSKKIDDIKEQEKAQYEAENDFNLWMNLYPYFVGKPEWSKIKPSYDSFMNYIESLSKTPK